MSVELDKGLLLALTCTLSLAARACNVGILLLFAGDGGALGELLRAALVGLANILCDSELLLSKLGKVGVVGLGFVLRLGLSLRLSVASSIGGSLLLFLLGNSFTSGFVSQLSRAIIATPAMSSLLLVLALDVSHAMRYISAAVTYPTPVLL